jgi:hypothetical protein
MTTPHGGATRTVGAQLAGSYRDVLRDGAGQVRWDSGVRSNVIVTDCRRLLAGFMRGDPTTTVGVAGLQVGTGEDAWDRPPGPPQATADRTALTDPTPFTVPRTAMALEYLVEATVSGTPTNRLQIVTTLGPDVPEWPQNIRTLREFGLVGALDGQPVLIDYVIHPAIPMDPVSTLERTIWLVF